MLKCRLPGRSPEPRAELGGPCRKTYPGVPGPALAEGWRPPCFRPSADRGSLASRVWAAQAVAVSHGVSKERKPTPAGLHGNDPLLGGWEISDGEWLGLLRGQNQGLESTACAQPLPCSVSPCTVHPSWPPRGTKGPSRQTHACSRSGPELATSSILMANSQERESDWLGLGQVLPVNCGQAGPLPSQKVLPQRLLEHATHRSLFPLAQSHPAKV